MGPRIVNTLEPSRSPLKELVERSQTIGADQSLVVYGGGNTSSKGEIRDYLGRLRSVLWVKGSGADMAVAGERDYPALYLEELLALREMDALDDETMTDYVTRALVDPTSRRPSIETLLHAFLPAKHIDHVHADAICALTNQAEGERAVREALGEGFAYVDWMRPGFALSKIAGALGNYDGIVLAHHGLIVWDDESAACLDRTHAAVGKANAYLDSLKTKQFATFRHDDPSDDEVRELLLALRGALAKEKKLVLRTDSRLREIADRSDVRLVADAGVASADHMMRMKPWAAALTSPAAETAADSVEAYRTAYGEYFERNREHLPAGYVQHDPNPRALLVPGIGAVTTGPTRKDAEVIADIALHSTSVAARVIDTFGGSKGIPESETFRFDYWPMELYKLKLRPTDPRFAGHVFVVTGAGSGIGRGIALELGSSGASVVLADLDENGLAEVESEFKNIGAPAPLVIPGDQSDERTVQAMVNSTIRHFGGFDGVIMNAGIGVSDNLEDLTEEKWSRGLRINLTSAFLLTRESMRALRAQSLGGSLVYVASKNAFAPGAGFGGYSVSKAGMLQLMRIAAIEGGSAGIRANAVNPDAVFDHSKLWAGGIREQRAAAHGVRPEDLEDFYASRNMLKVRVTTRDVANTVAHLLSDESSRTTGTVIAVDGGVAAAFPR